MWDLEIASLFSWQGLCMLFACKKVSDSLYKWNPHVNFFSFFTIENYACFNSAWKLVILCYTLRSGKWGKSKKLVRKTKLLICENFFCTKKRMQKSFKLADGGDVLLWLVGEAFPQKPFCEKIPTIAASHFQQNGLLNLVILIFEV